jgi:hypothetical protein
MAQKKLLAPLLSSKAIRMHPAQSLYEQVPPAPMQVKTTPSSKHETQIDIVVTEVFYQKLNREFTAKHRSESGLVQLCKLFRGDYLSDKYGLEVRNLPR